MIHLCTTLYLIPTGQKGIRKPAVPPVNDFAVSIRRLTVADERQAANALRGHFTPTIMK